MLSDGQADSPGGENHVLPLPQTSERLWGDKAMHGPLLPPCGLIPCILRSANFNHNPKVQRQRVETSKSLRWGARDCRRMNDVLEIPPETWDLFPAHS